MANNEILPFAGTDTGTNLLTQAEYLADAQRPIGNQPGVARSKLVNKALRQSSLIAAAVAQFIADNQANNVVDTATPADIADWIEAAVRSIGIPTAVAGGTADAITADFPPNVALTNGTTVIVRAGAANTTTTPTFSTDGLTAKTIVKGNNLALVAGDIAGAGHWLEMNFDTVLDKWVLQNPYSQGLQIASTAEAQALSNNTKAITPLRLNDAFKGSNQSLVANGYQRLPGGLIIQWGRRTIGDPNVDYFGTINFPIAFPNSTFLVNVALYSYAGGAFDASAAVTVQGLTGFDFTVQEWTSINQSIDVVYIAIGY